MYSVIKILVRSLLAIILLIFFSVGSLMIAMSTEWGQQLLYEYTFRTLQNILNTRLAVAEIKADILRGRVMLHGFELDDRAGVKMLKVDSVGAQLGLNKIFEREITIRGLYMKGASMFLYKNRPDSAANYQFVLDALKARSEQAKRKKAKEKKKKEPFLHISADMAKLLIQRTNFRMDILSAPRKGKDTLDANHIDIRNLSFVLEGNIQKKYLSDVVLKDFHVAEKNSGAVFTLQRASYHTHRQKDVDISFEGLRFRYQDKRVKMNTLSVQQHNGHFDFTRPLTLKVDSIFFQNDNHKPRKNFKKPNRGWFDPGHMNAVASLEATVNYLSKDSLYAHITHVEAVDRASGLDVRNLSAFLARSKDKITLTNIFIAMMRTRIRINKVDMRGTTVEDFPMEAKVYLQDIAKPFAPILSNFTTPLDLKLVVGGDIDRYLFKKICITTNDQRLLITGEGDLCDVTKKRDLTLHFWDLFLDASDGIKEQIVNHFSKKVRLKMQREMNALGDVRYKGKVGIFFKRQDISGTLFTRHGDIDFAFTLDGNTRHMSGTMNTDSLNLGAIMNVKNLHISRMNAIYDFDITSKRKAKMLGLKRKGRLPIGKLNATLGAGKYGSFNVKNLKADIESDGAVAEGHIDLPQTLVDIDVDFSYIQTDIEQGLRVHPKFHFTDKVRKFFRLPPRKDKDAKDTKDAKKSNETQNTKETKNTQKKSS